MNLEASNDLISQLRQSAIGLLARREYSRQELRQRLGRVEGADSVLEQLLEQLEQQGLQSDRRFTESFIRSRIGRGQGAVRIAQELRHKGITDCLRQELLEACGQDWFELARQVRERRFGGGEPEDRKAWAKQLRFLLYRGFSQDQARYALETGE